MTTRQLIEKDGQQVENGPLEELYELIRNFNTTRSSRPKPTLMLRLQEVQIDGPKDFAENFDRYQTRKRGDT